MGRGRPGGIHVHPAIEARPLFDASQDDSRLLVSNGNHLTILDAQTGKVVAEHDFAQPVVDLQILPDDGRALVVTQHTWGADATAPTTEIEVITLADGEASSFEVPNCASPLAITPDGARAFLSPTFCNNAVGVALIDVDLAAGTATKMNTSGIAPENINTSPDGKTLYLRKSASDVCIYDVASEVCTAVFAGPPAPNDHTGAL